ncbi:MFS transporter [Streptomyces avidinii]|uniref:MFS transporter n=1 Tax=Streptomyces avidinii TaxID=1895 RepID=UPI0037BC297E
MEAELAQQQEQASGLLREVGVLREQNRRLLEEPQAVSAPETQTGTRSAPEYAHLADRPHSERAAAAEEAITGWQQQPQHPERNPPPDQRAPTPARHSRVEARTEARVPSTAWIVVAVVVLALCAYTAVTVVIAVPAVGDDMTSALGPAASMVTCNLLAAAFARWSGRRGVRRYGHRIILLAGLLLLAVGALVASASPAYDMWAPRAGDRPVDRSAVQLLTGCALQGFGEGLCAAVAGAVLAARFRYPGPGKGTTWAVAAGSAIAVTASGLVLSTWVWRIAFQVPAVIAVLLLLALPFLPAFTSMPLRDDLAAADFSVLALMAGAHTAFVCAVARTPADGWWSPSVVALTALALALLAKASRRLHRTEAVQPLHWIRGGPLIWAWASGAVQYTAWLYCTLALQQVFGHEAWTAAALLLLAVPVAALVVFPGSFSTRLRAPVRTIGFLATARPAVAVHRPVEPRRLPRIQPGGGAGARGRRHHRPALPPEWTQGGSTAGVRRTDEVQRSARRSPHHKLDHQPRPHQNRRIRRGSHRLCRSCRRSRPGGRTDPGTPPEEAVPARTRGREPALTEALRDNQGPTRAGWQQRGGGNGEVTGAASRRPRERGGEALAY